MAITFYGVQYPPDKKGQYASRENLMHIMARYEQTHGRPAKYCLTSPLDAANIPEAPIDVRGMDYMPPGRMYVGCGDDAV